METQALIIFTYLLIYLQFQGSKLISSLEATESDNILSLASLNHVIISYNILKT